ncbi:MAG: hypoxanthine phosphoribosyltransferase [Pseudomonadota bacterium]
MAEPPASHPIAILYSAETIAARVDALARDIAQRDLRAPLILAVLKGSFIFVADLIRALHAHGLKPEIDFIFLASYGAGTSGGPVEILRDVQSDVSGRDVVIVDDILDSGRTLLFARERLKSQGARTVLSCVLLDKKARRTEVVAADFTGFECPDRFVVGYGMDLGNHYRELPYIGTIEPAD